jgi:hypothetical protein
MWARACQRDFPTTEVALVGQTLEDSSEAKRFVFIFSIVVFVLPFLLYLCGTAWCHCNTSVCGKIGSVYILVCTLIEIIFQIVLIIYQSQTISILKTVNPALISYAVDN